MGLIFCLRLALLVIVWSTAHSTSIPDGVLQMECHDRHIMIAVDLSFSEEVPRFEAVDEKGVNPITEKYAAECGYSTDVLTPNRIELRASVFSCHTENKDDKVFTFNFNLIVTQEGKEIKHALNKTCSPSLPWSPREVTCELNYMEVTVRNEVPCPSGAKKEDWDAIKQAYNSTTSDWQVMLQKGDEQLPPISLSEARKQGYMFDLTTGRLVFRTPYGQPDSFSTEVNGVPVEVAHVILFSRQSWVVLMVDLVAACSKDEGSYEDSGYMMWATPEELYPSTHSTHLKIGLGGELVEQQAAEDKGYVVENHNNTIHIGIPYDADGGYRKSLVSEDLFEFYVFHLYLEQILVDEDLVETRLRSYKTLTTPLLSRSPVVKNQTILEDQFFTIFLGDVPEDVELTAVNLNGHELAIPFINTSSHTINRVVYPNNTRGYFLNVPFDDPVVVHQFSKEDAVLKYSLDINYTLTVQPENETFYHLASFEATFTDIAPPVFDVVCSESGIIFKKDHRPFDYMWVLCIGIEALTPELAAQYGYIMKNDSQSLMLEVPLFTHGLQYKDISLKGFSGTFEILMMERETSEVQGSTSKTCQFSPSEFIFCSTDGRMTAVVDLSLAMPIGGNPARTNLVDVYCGPKETDGNRALFSLPLNSCGSNVKLGKENVTYQNEIFYRWKDLSVKKLVSETATQGVLIQCTYPLAGLHRLFSVYRFDSDTVGDGNIIHIEKPSAVLQSPMILPTTPAAKRPLKRPFPYRPAIHPPAHYIKVSTSHNFPGFMTKGAERHSQQKVDVSKI